MTFEDKVTGWHIPSHSLKFRSWLELAWLSIVIFPRFLDIQTIKQNTWKTINSNIPTRLKYKNSHSRWYFGHSGSLYQLTQHSNIFFHPIIQLSSRFAATYYHHFIVAHTELWWVLRFSLGVQARQRFFNFIILVNAMTWHGTQIGKFKNVCVGIFIILLHYKRDLLKSCNCRMDYFVGGNFMAKFLPTFSTNLTLIIFKLAIYSQCFFFNPSRANISMYFKILFYLTCIINFSAIYVGEKKFSSLKAASRMLEIFSLPVL